MIDIDKAHTLTRDGLYLEDGPHFVGGVEDPRVFYPNPLDDTHYFQLSTGTLWRFVSGRWETVESHVPYELDRVWSLPFWAQALATKPIDFANDVATVDIEGSLIFDDLKYAQNEPGIPQVFPENFSYQKIDDALTVTIPDNQQMVVDHEVEILGVLEINGTLSILFDADESPVLDTHQNNFSFDKIVDLVFVPLNQQMFLDYPLEIDGVLDLEGRVVVETADEQVIYPENFSFRVIPENKILRIFEFQDMLIADSFEILGTIDLEGSFTVFYF